MEATAKGTLMDCGGCNELLADFLLDELPESDAVLVHEHLLTCPACMKAYRDLKGTGKSLEAITSMQPVAASDDFRNGVRMQAKVEADKIVAKLPPDKRLRLEARREARHSIRLSHRQAPPPKVWSPGLLILALVGAAILAGILIWPKDKPAARTALGSLSIVLGKVEEFYQKENHPHTQVAEGKSISTGDSFSTGELGRARFNLVDGGALFLGPSSDVTFRQAPSENGALALLVENGEIGFLRPDASGSAAGGRSWEVRSDAGTLTVPAGCHVYVRIAKTDKKTAMDVTVIAGSVHAASRDGARGADAHAGQIAQLSSADASLAVDSFTEQHPVPAWRVDLLSEQDLAGMFGGKGKIISRQPAHVQLELTYNAQTPTRDWIAEIGDSALKEKSGALRCPTIKLKHAAQFAPPLAFEIKLNPESRHETSFALGVLEAPGMGVAVDVTRHVELTIQEKGKLPRRDSIATRAQPGAPESFLLQVKSEGAGYSASLSSSSGKTKSLPLWKEKADAPGDIWLYALGEGILIDEIKISGTLPVDWLREKLGAAE